jgi:hypothetical protein
VRYLCVNHHPDHDSICTFRTANKQAFKAAFVSVLPPIVRAVLKRMASAGGFS